MADNLDGEFAQQVDVVVVQGLARCHHDALSGMYAQRVKVLHVADRDAVVVAVANHLELDLLPTLERLLYQHLGRI